MNSEHWDDMPAVVANLKADVEAEAQVEIYFQGSDDEDGAMTFQWLPTGLVVFCRDYSHAGAAEELLHIRLDIRGFLRLRLLSNCHITRQAITALHNVFQHAVIFPQLERMGFSQDEGECISVFNQYDKYKEENFDSSRFQREPCLRALFAVFYVRAVRHCPDVKVQILKNSLFQNPGYADAKILGERVLPEINLDENTSPEHYNSVMKRCLNVLNLEDVVKLVQARSEE